MEALYAAKWNARRFVIEESVLDRFCCCFCFFSAMFSATGFFRADSSRFRSL